MSVECDIVMCGIWMNVYGNVECSACKYDTYGDSVHDFRVHQDGASNELSKGAMKGMKGAILGVTKIR